MTVDAVLDTTGPVLPAVSVTAPAASVAIMVPSGGVAPPLTVTVYAVPDPLTPLTLQPLEVPVNEKSLAARPVTDLLKVTE